MKYVIELVEYLLGFMALTVFSVLAFRSVTPTDATWRTAFIVGGALAAVELAVLLFRSRPANRLILGANAWLMGGAVAFVTKQWWILQVYDRWQAAGLVGCMLGAGLIATVVSRAGFVAVEGERWKVLAASLLLIAATGGLLWYVLVATGPIYAVLVAPLTALALLARVLRIWVDSTGPNISGPNT